MSNNLIKAKAIYQDQRIAEEFCNFRCDYCEGFSPSGYSLRTDSEGNLQVPAEWYDIIKTSPDKVKAYFVDGCKMDKYYQLALEIMDRTREIVDSDILKISGGEITTNKNLLEFVKSIHNKYLSIQILTNGLNIKRDELREYKKMRNVSFQVSIDGATPETNYAKSHSENITKKVLENIDSMIAEGLGVEINCVLTKYNVTDKYLEFLERYKEADNFIVFPRPVRGNPREKLDFSKEQISIFEKALSENYEKYVKILPPKIYFDRVVEMMKIGKRLWNCYLPYFILSIDGYGNFEKCPIGIMPDAQQNILIDGTVKTKSILVNTDYQQFNDYQKCKYCMVQYEMINLYVEGLISKEELRRMPSINSDQIVMSIEKIKKLIRKD